MNRVLPVAIVGSLVFVLLLTSGFAEQPHWSKTEQFGHNIPKDLPRPQAESMASQGDSDERSSGGLIRIRFNQRQLVTSAAIGDQHRKT